MTTTKGFDYTILSQGPATTVVRLRGELRRGLGDQMGFINFQTELILLEKKAASELVLFDVTELRYWDTLGINLLIPMMEHINAKFGNRTGFFGPKTTPLFEAAKDKYGYVGTPKVPWTENENELIAALTG